MITLKTYFLLQKEACFLLRLVEGVLFTIVGCFGFLGNLGSILILITPQVNECQLEMGISTKVLPVEAEIMGFPGRSKKLNYIVYKTNKN